jgi:phosphoglycolate phosphatase
MIILFDLDGTLIDSTDAIVSTFHHSYNIHNTTHPTDKEIMALIGYPLDIMYKKLGIKDSEIWDFVATYKKRYREISTQQTKLLPYSIEAVSQAHKFAKLGIVTTKTGSYSKILMQHFDLMQYFDVLIGREDVANPKPHQEPILKALEILKCDTQEIWMIGDTKLDLISAKNADIKSIGVLSGYDNSTTLKKYTDLIFNDALEAVKYLENKE